MFIQYEEFKTTASEDELRYFEEFLKYKETNDPTFLTSSEAVDLRKKIGASKVRKIEDLIKRKGWA